VSLTQSGAGASSSLPAPDTVTAEDSLDDPLLGCLENIARIHDRAIPKQAFVTGLPLVNGQLTTRLFPRAAERAGLSAKVVRRKITSLDKILLPAVLILSDHEAVVLTGYDAKKAKIILPETGHGSTDIKLAELEKRYSGYAILIKPEYQFGEDQAPRASAPEKHWFWDCVTPLWPTYAQVLIAASIVNILALASPLFVMNVYDRVLPNKALSTLWVLAIGMAIAISFDFILRTVRNALVGNAGRRADVMLAGKILQHVLRIDMSHRPADTGAFANHLKDYEIVREFFTSNTLITITDLVFVGLFIFIIYLIAGVTALVPAVAVVLVILVGLMLQFPLSRIVNQAQSEAAHRHSILLEAISGLETIKLARAESQMQRRWEQFVGQNSRTSANLRFLSSVGLNFTTFIQQLVTVGIIIVGVYLFDQGEISPGALIAAVILAGRAVAPLGQVASTIARSQQAFHSLRTLDEIMSTPEEGDEQDRHMDRKIASGAIDFQDVTFTYPESGVAAIKQFSLKIEPGERIGIIGKIGSGKSTLGRLLARLYVPGEGSLLIDGVDVRQYLPSEIRRQVSYVAQDAKLFRGTVRDNIVFGAPHVSDDLVVRAAELAGVSDFIQSNPSGYNMPVGEDGRALSSGQRQAVALARAFLFDPAVVFLDEPSGSMDMATERALLERLRTAFRPDQTLIITTHRMAMLALVDRLVVIDGGKIVADGPRDGVLKRLAQLPANKDRKAALTQRPAQASKSQPKFSGSIAQSPKPASQRGKSKPKRATSPKSRTSKSAAE
jgi:ATP-binding cassette subfamily C protein LapB